MDSIFLVIILSLLGLMALKVPVAWAMIISSVLALLADGSLPMIIVAQRLWGGLESFPLLAIPLFVFAGNLMNIGGGAERIFAFCMSIIGHVKGGLAYVNVLSSIIFAGMSGAATADAAGLGQIEIEAMLKEGYAPEYSAAITAASSIIGPIIPPSIPFVIYGVMAQVSIGSLFLAGLVPGLLIGIMLLLMIYFPMRRSSMKVRPRSTFKQIAAAFKDSFWALLAPVIILGGIFSGVFTPTEAGAAASLYALILGFIYKRIKLKDLPKLLGDTMLATAQVTFTVAAAGLFGWILTRYNFPSAVTELLLSVTSNKYVALLLINIALLILGCFIDATALLIMMTPVLIPIANSFGISLIHMGLIVVICCMIGINTPPVGICLYIVSDIAKASMAKVVKQMMPFYIAYLVSLFFISAFPQISLFLPNLIKL
ncbi:MAG: TRAP transporter large permease [Spirochaetota bacterium]